MKILLLVVFACALIATTAFIRSTHMSIEMTPVANH
jgi:hypothetical protein